MSFIERQINPEQPEQPVAFFAYRSIGNAANPHDQHTLVYDIVKTNLGHGYKRDLGVFMVPQAGTYFFSWTIFLDLSSYHSARLIVNTEVQSAVYARTDSTSYASTTGNAILTLNKGDEVFIQTSQDVNKGRIVSDQYRRTSFTGFLII